MKQASADDYINFSLVIIYFVGLITLILCFEWIRNFRRDTRKEIVKDAFQKMVDSIGLSDMSNYQMQVMLSKDYSDITNLVER